MFLDKWKNIKNWKDYQDKIFNLNKSNNVILTKINFSDYSNSLNIPFSIKNNYWIKNHQITGGTRFLSNFYPNENSTVFNLLAKKGFVPLFSTNLDELAMGGTGLSSGFGIIKNPIDSTRITGGSSSGSAFQVANGDVEFSIGSDTGDSVRKPASYVGIVGFKPTWGLVSRNGMFDFAPSLDAVSWFTNNVDVSALLLDILEIKDYNDFSNIDTKNINNYLQNINNFTKKKKIVYFKNLISEIKSENVKNNFLNLISKLKQNEIQIDEIDFDINLLKLVLPTYKVITSVEAFSCNSNLSGFLFGDSNENEDYENLLIKTRTQKFDYEVKKRFLFANYSIHNTNAYSKAIKIRTLIINFLNKIFEKYDCILMPATPTDAPKIVDLQTKGFSDSLLEDYLTLFNLNGSPSITIPNYNKEIELPSGINISSKPFDDLTCLQTAKFLEKIINQK